MVKSQKSPIAKLRRGKPARVLELLFGLNGRPPHNLREVGEKFGLTKERIRQIELEALGRLRHPARAARLRELE